VSEPTNETEPETAAVDAPVEDDGPDMVTERHTFGGEGPEGQPDTVDETASVPQDEAESAVEPVEPDPAAEVVEPVQEPVEAPAEPQPEG
jgi:hypothetical protein